MTRTSATSTISISAPQIVRPFDGWKFAPYVQGVKSHRNPETYRMIHSVDPSVRHRVNFFVRGHEYKLFQDIHLMGQDPFYILGSDLMGRDMWFRIAYGARISLTVGLVGVTISLFLGRADRRHLRPLRRRNRPAHPATHRALAIHSVHTALADSVRRYSRGLVSRARLLRHHGHSVRHGMDRPGKGDERPLPRPARGRFRHGRPSLRHRPA